MEASRAQLQAIGERVTLAQAKIEKIKGSKKAIKVLTSVKAAWPPFFLPPSLFTPDISSGEEQVLGCRSCCLLTSPCLAAEQGCDENPLPKSVN